MSKVGQIERASQNRIVKLFQEVLQNRYLGNWEQEDENSNVDEILLSHLRWLPCEITKSYTI